jgi:GTP-binding protein EngB required for normal cell division
MTDTNAIASKSTQSEIIERLQAIHTKYALAAIQQHLNACADLLHNQNTIDVGIIGRFKAGKSSLLNLLSNRPVLPVGVTPVTTVVTRLRYGHNERAEIHYANDRTETVPVESVKSFVSETENPGNIKKVKSVTVELPSLMAYNGLQFVDTPGLESVFQHNTEAALDWLPKIGLALVTISVDPPLSKNDVELIRNLRGYTPRIAILLTKADLVSESEREEIVTFVRSELRKEFGNEFQTLLFSVRPGYEHFKTDLNHDLLFPMMETRNSARAEIVRFKFRSLLDHTKDYVSLALAAANRVDADRDRLRAQILDEKTNLESIRMELQALATECAGQTRPWIMKRTEELRPDLQQRLTQELRDKLSGLKANLYNLSRAYEQWLREAMKREMRDISIREGDLFIIPLEKARDTLSRAIRGFHDRLVGNIQKTLGMRFQGNPFEINLQKPSSPDVAISKLFMFNTDLCWFVIPMKIFRSLADRHFLHMIPWETKKNLSRLASQWTERINDAILKMRRDAELHVRDQISTVESLLTRTQSEAEEIRTSLLEIESFQRTIFS